VLVIGGGDDVGGDAGEFGVPIAVGGMKEEGNETGTGWNDLDAKLTGQVIAERGSTHFRNGEAAGGDDEDGGGKVSRLAMSDKFRGVMDFADLGIEENLDGSGAGFRFKEVDDV